MAICRASNDLTRIHSTHLLMLCASEHLEFLWAIRLSEQRASSSGPVHHPIVEVVKDAHTLHALKFPKQLVNGEVVLHRSK